MARILSLPKETMAPITRPLQFRALEMGPPVKPEGVGGEGAARR